MVQSFTRQTVRGSSFWLSHQSRKMEKGKPRQEFDHFFVLDFEATCDTGKYFKPQEIIEFPCIKLHPCTFQPCGLFHEYIRPLANPTLTNFCTELTGITQDMVDDADEFSTVFQRFQTWFEAETVEGSNVAFITCGDWDLRTMLPGQCEVSGLEIPDYLRRWINVKKSFSREMRHFPRSMAVMMKNLRLTFEGRPHSGIDDTKNIAKIVQTLGIKGHVFEINGVRSKR